MCFDKPSRPLRFGVDAGRSGFLLFPLSLPPPFLPPLRSPPSLHPSLSYAFHTWPLICLNFPSSYFNLGWQPSSDELIYSAFLFNSVSTFAKTGRLPTWVQYGTTPKYSVNRLTAAGVQPLLNLKADQCALWKSAGFSPKFWVIN